MEERRPTELVPDWDTKRVLLVLPVAEMKAYDPLLPELESLYAEWLRELARHEDVACVVPDAARAERMMRLSGLGEDHFPLARAPDIRIRDFAPLCTRGPLVRFDDGRTEAQRRARVTFATLLGPRWCAARHEPLALDGGNLVHDGAGIGLATRMLVRRNRGRAAAERVRAALGLRRLVLVPPAPGDPDGRASAMLRFAGPELLLVNDHARESGGRELQRCLDAVLDRRLGHALRVMLPPVRVEDTPPGAGSARASYTSFLLTAQRAYVPAYGVPEDREAEAVFECVFGGRVSWIHAGPLVRCGGSLHDLAWTYV